MRSRSILAFVMGLTLLCCADASAQFHNFYLIGTPPPGTTYKPGKARAIIDHSSAGIYVTAGSAVDADYREAFSLAQYDYAGNNIVTMLFEPNHDLFQYCIANDVCELGGDGYAMAGTMSGIGGARSMLIVTDPSGNYLWHTPINDQAAISVVYNTVQKEIAVLGRGFGTSGPNDFEFFIAVYDMSGSLMWSEHYGTPNHDEPRGLMYDESDNSYVATGMSWDAVMSDQQVLTIKVDAYGNWIWGNTYGDPLIYENGTAVNLAVNNNDYVVTGTCAMPSQAEPIVMELDKNTGMANYFNRYSVASVGDNIPHSIVQNGNGDYYLAGFNRMANTNGMLLRVSGSGTGMWYTFYGQVNLPGEESFYDMTPNIAKGEFALVGDHRYSGLDFPWIVVTDNGGRGVCYDEYDMATVPVTFNTDPAAPRGTMATLCCEELSLLDPAYSVIMDECLYPFKTAEGSGTTDMSLSESAVPQPASDMITLRYGLPGGTGGSWILRDVLGRVVMTQNLAPGSSELGVNLQKLGAGVYFYEYVIEGRVAAQNKLLIVR